MIYKICTQFLHKFYPDRDDQFVLSEKDGQTLLKYLLQKHTHSEIIKERKKIYKAFSDYFRVYGNPLIHITKDSITCTLEKYKVDPKKSKSYATLIAIIYNNLTLVEFPYRGANDLIHIKQELFEMLKKIILSCDEQVNKNALLTLALHEALKLNTKAVVTPLDDHAVIKIFQEFDTTHLGGKEKESKKSNEERFNGYEEEELKRHTEIIFSEIIPKDEFLDLVLSNIYHTELNFHKISNAYYEKNALALIKNIFTAQLSLLIDNNQDYLSGLAGYMFRITFEDIHKRIALYLLKKLYLKESEIIRFLSYYNQEKVKIKDTYYKVPTLKNSDGALMKLTTISSIASLWLNPYLKYESIKNSYDLLLKQNRNELKASELLEKRKKQLNGDIANLSGKIKQAKIFIQTIDNKLSLISDQKKRNSLKELNEKQYKIYQDFYRENIPIYEKKNLQLSKVERKYQLHQANIKKNSQLIAQYEEDMRQLKKNYSSNQASFDQVLVALTNSLIQRKKLIKG